MGMCRYGRGVSHVHLQFIYVATDRGSARTSVNRFSILLRAVCSLLLIYVEFRPVFLLHMSVSLLCYIDNSKLLYIISRVIIN